MPPHEKADNYRFQNPNCITGLLKINKLKPHAGRTVPVRLTVAGLYLRTVMSIYHPRMVQKRDTERKSRTSRPPHNCHERVQLRVTTTRDRNFLP